MADRPLYITRPEGDDLYTLLQRRTLDELQRLSGEVWSDYNPSDPGVTVADAVDYALTETDYKLGFALEDYLSDPDGTWQVGRYGLFPASEVYPSAPVTADDYRKIVLARFPMVQNMAVTADKKRCAYDFTLRLSPYFNDEDGIVKRIRSFLNRHRNLCEHIGRIEVLHPKELTFSAELEILPGYNATEILVRIYWTAMQYLSGSVRLEMDIPGSPEKGYGFDTWYDGPVKDVRVTIPQQADTQRELYWKLCGIEGVKYFKTCWFKDLGGHIVTDFSGGYALAIPDDCKEVTVLTGGERADIDMDELKERLKALYFMRSTLRMRDFMQKHGRGMQEKDVPVQETARKARYRNVYGHYPVAGDLPRCYRTSEKDFRAAPPERRKRKR